MQKNHTITYQLYDSKESLPEEEQNLVESAEKVRSNAYAPYSKFTVGAAALLENGELVLGNNQENIAYPSGLCAERVALFYAGSNYPSERVKTLCVVAQGDLVGVNDLLSPCGGCRQVMAETEKRQSAKMKVILVNQDGTILVFDSASDLLPLTFGS